MLGDIVHDVTGFGVTVSWLSDAPDIDEIAPTGLDLQFGVGTAFDACGIANERQRVMSVAKEADWRILVGEAGGSFQLIKNVPPALRGIQGGMDYGKIVHQTEVPKLAQPLPVIEA